MRFCPICGNEGTGPTCPTDGVTLIEKSVEVNLAGSTLKGTYRVERKIGEGGFGAVYEGTQLALGRRVAIKTLLPGLERDPSLVTRFFREESPGFVSLEGYIVGCLLVDALKRCKRFNREELVDVLEQTKGLDLGLGSSIDFGPSDHEGSERIWGTVLGKDFRFESVDLNS